ncbi:MAG: type 4a pilus biogenesis protein PilO [Candidatus Sumerlaeaceae bacterium]
MLDKLTPPQRDAIKAGSILAIVLFGGAYAFYAYYIQPEMKRNYDLVAKIDVEIKDLNRRLAEMDEAEKNMELLKQKQEYLRQIAAKLPSSIAPQEFYNAMIEILQTTRVDYSALAQLKLEERQVYTEIPYMISGKGRYHDFGQFLNMVEENPVRLMRVKKFTVENDDRRPSIHPITVELATFMFNKRTP